MLPVIEVKQLIKNSVKSNSDNNINSIDNNSSRENKNTDNKKNDTKKLLLITVKISVRKQ